jgi:hypothetical protein
VQLQQAYEQVDPHTPSHACICLLTWVAGERLSPWVGIACFIMGFSILFS